MVKQGDIIRLNFNPQAGHEQSGRRPALVISNEDFSRITRTAAMVCPITRTNKRLPFHISLDERTNTAGMILCDQAKIMDIHARNYEFIEQAPPDIVLEVIDTVRSFIEILQ
ncbi:MAG: type II toxin-antitoxin system PemK/MazF family toxin [Defluviitaleaceae bacterium]|nr:type II toxin-antitoxin system PemK/MazF family toxin [Defluviitaleaceae bacterium]